MKYRKGSSELSGSRCEVMQSTNYAGRVLSQRRVKVGAKGVWLGSIDYRGGGPRFSPQDKKERGRKGMQWA